MRRLKVLLFSKYSRRGPSSRLRSLQYLPLLQEHGIDVRTHELFPDAYLDLLYHGKATSARYRGLWYGGKRLLQLLREADFDLIWLEGELFPYLPMWIESALLRSRRPYVVDYDDALFHRYDMSSSALVRRLLGRKIDQVMRGAVCVVVGNGYLAERASSAGARRIEIIPTVVDDDRYDVATHDGAGKPVIGWIGSPATESYVLDYRELLEKVCERNQARLRLVGAQKAVAGQFEVTQPEVVEWSEDTEAGAIAGMDIGIMPLRDSPWERGKCGYKIVQYMACGLPVVASAVGANVDIVRHGENGFLASNDAEWRDYLQRLIADPPLRHHMGSAGRRSVEEHYSIRQQAPRLAALLRSAGGS
ncbi:glycosyltransferase family 4 protein [Dyella japonica]|uniref:Glycosyl transferase family 1 n=1 Tax=Dyella japonica A8 TaxID=1217721 RepID=A0A075K168_9GAMM|nr:glycosyltransferase family 4 protein [Dyella japonica]AIF47934.1 glycosyl transferase family 1 [Dyella japonica A8]